MDYNPQIIILLSIGFGTLLGVVVLALMAMKVNRARVFYGPHRCQDCGQMICRSMHDQMLSESNFHYVKLPVIAYDYPEGPIYPNTLWREHDCPSIQYTKVGDRASLLPDGTASAGSNCSITSRSRLSCRRSVRNGTSYDHRIRDGKLQGNGHDAPETASKAQRMRGLAADVESHPRIRGDWNVHV